MVVLHSQCRVFCTIRRALVFVESSEGSGCHSFTDVEMLKSLCALSVLFSTAAVTVKIEMCCVEFTEWIKWRGCWLCRERLWLRLWVCCSASEKMNFWFLFIDSHIDFLRILPGHKPEGGKEQPNYAFSVQGGQTVETAAGTIC